MGLVRSNRKVTLVPDELIWFGLLTPSFLDAFCLFPFANIPFDLQSLIPGPELWFLPLFLFLVDQVLRLSVLFLDPGVPQQIYSLFGLLVLPKQTSFTVFQIGL